MKKYIQIRVFHPGKGTHISAAVEAEISEEVFNKGSEVAIFDVVAMPIFMKLSDANIDAHYPVHLIYNLKDTPQKSSDFVGTVDELILHIIKESKKKE